MRDLINFLKVCMEAKNCKCLVDFQQTLCAWAVKGAAAEAPSAERLRGGGGCARIQGDYPEGEAGKLVKWK